MTTMAATTSIVKYNGGPLWQNGYTWQDIYWGTYYTKPSAAAWMKRLELAVLHLETDTSYSGGLSQYNVGMGKVIGPVTIQQDPPSQLSNDQIGKTLTAWINSGTVADLGTSGAYNIFLPPGITASLSGDQSCQTFCVPPDTILLGDNKPIIEYGEGDHVVGASGLQNVVRRVARPYDGQLVEIKAGGMLPLLVTPEHPVLVVRGVGHEKTAYASPEWKIARQIEEKGSSKPGDYLIVPRLEGHLNDTAVDLAQFVTSKKSHPKMVLFPLTEQTAWVLGVYVAEGNSASNGLNFTLNSTEESIRETISKSFQTLGYSSCRLKRPTDGVERIFVTARVLARAFAEWCGKGATGKRIPDFILYHRNLELLRAFLDGYTAGDGCKVWNRRYELLIVNTVSKVLIQQLQLAFARLGLLMSIRKSRAVKRDKILGREVNYHEQYEGRLYPKPTRTKMNRLHGKYFYVPVRRVSTLPYVGQVFNIETSDHTFLVSNAIVHNCDYHDTVNGDSGPFYTVEPYPCSSGCNQCTKDPFDTLTQGLSEEIVELKTDMNPGTGWVIGNEEICDYCDAHFVCNKISSGEYVNAWYDKSKNACWIGRQ
jgi:hypothetical protein